MPTFGALKVALDVFRRARNAAPEILPPDDRVLVETEQWKQPAVIRVRLDDDGPRLNLANDVPAGRLAEVRERVPVAGVLRVHVRDRVNAIAPVSVPRGLADGVDALVADLPRIHEPLLH